MDGGRYQYSVSSPLIFERSRRESLLRQGALPRKPAMPKSRAVLNRAVAALRGGNVGQARMMLLDRLAVDPTDANALTKLAEIAVDEGLSDQATIFLRRAADADPSPQLRIALVRHLHKYGSPGMVLKEIDDLTPALRAQTEIMKIEASASG